MKKGWSILLMPLLLCGCAAIPSEEQLEAELQQKTEDSLSEIQAKDAEYAAYQKQAESHVLDENGYYHQSEMDIPERDPNMIRVTFAKNAQLDVLYYYDEAHEKPILPDEPCYIAQGDSIYAAEPEHVAAGDPNYAFDGFLLYSYDESGSRRAIEPESDSDQLTIRLPAERTVHDISVVPTGAYKRRTLKLEAWCLDADGRKNPADGTWSQNGEKIRDKTFEIVAPESYRFSYEYESDKYYVKECSGGDASQNGDKVTFQNVTVQQETLSVLLKPFLTATIKSADQKGIQEVRIHERNQPADSKGDYQIMKVKPGDKIMIRTTPEYKIKCDELKAKQLTYNKINNGYDFLCTVPDQGEALQFQAVPWGKKEIALDIDAHIIDKLPIIRNLTDKAEDNLLSLKSGTEIYSYKDLKTKKQIEVNEAQGLSLVVNPDISSQSNLAYEVSVNGRNPVYIYKDNQEAPELSFSETEKLAITVKKGFVFSYKNLDNGKLDVTYQIAGSRAVLKENQFLPENTEIAVTVNNANQYTVTGGAVEAGRNFGTITVTDKTNISDFAVQYRAEE